jgi:two-component system invasion response regulator UvrY
MADDHPIVRAGLKQFVSETIDMMVSDEAINGEEVIDKALKSHYDVVLLDLNMPGKNGLDIIKHLKSHKPEVKILVLSIYPEEQYAIRVLKAGALGYLPKESAPQELISAIRKVASGNRYITSSLAEKLAFDFGPRKKELLHQTLSDREFQVMCMIANGKKLSDIGKELSISIKTVSSYHSRILKKLNLQNNAELIRYSIDNQLIK